jgi:hypothetical protein
MEQNVEDKKQVRPANPLAEFYRQPKLYVSLPSNGYFTDEKNVVLTASGEVGVMAMTAKDEALMKSPDALLNGEAVVEVIKSCCPGILNPMDLPQPDIDILMLAIRMATFGREMEIQAKSPHSGNTDTYVLNIEELLSEQTKLEKEYPVHLENGCTVYIRPHSYAVTTQIQLRAFEETKAIQQAQANTEQSIQNFSKSFRKLADMSNDVMVHSISKIRVPSGEETNDSKQIREFVLNVPSTDIKKVDTKIAEINRIGLARKRTVVCKETQKEFDADVEFDISSFFVTGS